MIELIPFADMYSLCTVGIPSLALIGYSTATTDRELKYSLLKSKTSLYTTAGVLCTFVGIYNGLQTFDVSDIAGSIPDILSGFKGSFSSSIIGMSCSILSNIGLDLRFKDCIFSEALNKSGSSGENLKEDISSIKNILLDISKKIQESSSSDNYIFSEIKKHQDLNSRISAEVLKVLKKNSETLERSMDNNLESLVDSLQEVMIKFDDKISSHFQGVITDMITQMREMSIMINKNLELHSSLVNNKDDVIEYVRELDSNFSLMKTKSTEMAEKFESLLGNYIRMEKNAESACEALKDISGLSYKAKEGSKNLDQFFKEFSEGFNKVYEKDIKKATELQAEHLINITYTILSQIKEEVSRNGR